MTCDPGLDTPELVLDVERMETLFLGELGYERASSLGLDPGRRQFLDALRDFAKSPDRREDDHLVVYVACHGRLSLGSGEHYLLFSDTDPDDLPGTALRPEEIARSLWEETELRCVLIMLDACFSGAAAHSVVGTAHTARRLSGPRESAPQGDLEKPGGEGLVVVSSSRSKEETFPGVLTKAFARAVRGEPTAGSVPEFLSLDTVLGRTSTDSSIPKHMRVKWDVADASATLRFLPNPRYLPGVEGRHLDEIDRLVPLLAREKRDRRDDVRTHFLPRARGTDVPQDNVWNFTGRHRALRELVEWIRPPEQAAGRLTVVTGDPGSGKSALLGLVNVLSDRDYRPSVPVETMGLSADCVPAPGAVEVAILASHKSAHQVRDAIAAAAGMAVESVGALMTRLQALKRPLVLVIDAVDEALDPDELVESLLRPLSDPAVDLPLRLVLGVRKHLVERHFPLAPRIDLDDDAYADPEAVRAYASKLLTAAGSALPVDDVPYVNAVAAAVAEAAGRSFLVARITALTLAREPRLPDPSDLRWRAELPRLPGEAMERDLRQRLGEETGRARDLLLPLAYAQGAGLPWADFWPVLATALAGRPYGDDDIRWLRRHAGSYIVEGSENGNSVYRIYHRALIEYLREGRDTAEIQRTVTDTLLAVEARSGWLPPYVGRYLPVHAAQGGGLDKLVQDARFVLTSDLGQLLSALPALSTPEGKRAGRTIRHVADQLRTAPEGSQRLALLRWAAVCLSATALAESCDAAGPMPWRARWAVWNPEEEAWRFTSAELASDTGSVVSDEDGPAFVPAQQLAPAGFWDLGSGTFEKRLGSVASRRMATRVWGTAEFGRKAVFATLSDSWGADRGESSGLTRFQARRFRSLVVGALRNSEEFEVRIADDETASESASRTVVQFAAIPGEAVLRFADDSLEFWTLPRALSHRTADPVDAQMLRTGLPVGRSGFCVALRLPEPCLVLECEGGVVVRQADGRNLFVQPGHEKPVTCAAGVHPHPLGALLVTGGADGGVRVSSTVTGRPVITLLREGPPVVALGSMPVEDQWLVGAVTDDGFLHRWDLKTGRRLGMPVRVGRGGPARMTATRINRPAVMVVHGSGRGVQMYDMVTGERVGGYVSGGETTALCEIGSERRAVCAAGRDGLIKVSRSGRAVDTTLLAAHSGRVLALGGVRGPDGTTGLISVGDDYRVRCWDPEDGREIWTWDIPVDERWEGSVLTCAAVQSFDDGTSVVVVGDAGGHVRSLLLADGAPVKWAEPRCEAMVTAVGAGMVEGSHVAVAATSEGEVVCWGLESGRWLTRCEPVTDRVWITALAVAADGSGVLVAGTERGVLLRWDLPSGRRVGPKRRPHGGRVNDLAFISDGHGAPCLVSASDDRRVIGFEVTGEELVQRAGIRTTPAINVLAPRSVANGGLFHVLGGDDSGTVQVLWRFWKDTAWRVNDLIEDARPPTAVSGRPPGQVVVASERGDLHLREIGTGRLLAHVRSVSDRPVREVTGFVTGDGSRYVASFSADSLVECWDLTGASFRTAGRAVVPPWWHAGAESFKVTDEGERSAKLLLSRGRGTTVVCRRIGLPTGVAADGERELYDAPKGLARFEIDATWPVELHGRHLLFASDTAGVVRVLDMRTRRWSSEFRLPLEHPTDILGLSEEGEPTVLVVSSQLTAVCALDRVLASLDGRSSATGHRMRQTLELSESPGPGRGFVGILPGDRSYATLNGTTLAVYEIRGGGGIAEIQLPFRPTHTDFGPEGELILATRNGVVLVDPVPGGVPVTPSPALGTPPRHTVRRSPPHLWRRWPRVY